MDENSLCIPMVYLVKLAELNADQQALIALVLAHLYFLQTHYENGEYIIRQGARGDTFFIISKGKVSSCDIVFKANVIGSGCTLWERNTSRHYFSWIAKGVTIFHISFRHCDLTLAMETGLSK